MQLHVIPFLSPDRAMNGWARSSRRLRFIFGINVKEKTKLGQNLRFLRVRLRARMLPASRETSTAIPHSQISTIFQSNFLPHALPKIALTKGFHVALPFSSFQVEWVHFSPRGCFLLHLQRLKPKFVIELKFVLQKNISLPEMWLTRYEMIFLPRLHSAILSVSAGFKLQ